MFETLNERAYRGEEGASGIWARILAYGGILLAVLCLTFVLFWALHIGILIAE